MIVYVKFTTKRGERKQTRAIYIMLPTTIKAPPIQNIQRIHCSLTWPFAPALPELALFTRVNPYLRGRGRRSGIGYTECALKGKG